jgi:hypothetical protein
LSDGNQKRRVSNYLLNKSLQLRYVVLVTAMSTLIAGVLGFLIWRQETYASAKILAAFNASAFASDPELRSEIVDRLTTYDTGLVQTMGLAAIGLILGLSAYLIVMTHKVAGPLYKVGIYFDKMADGRLGPVWPLRRGDMLVDFYDTFRRAHEALRARHVEGNAAIGRFLAACDAVGVAGGPLGAVLDELRTHHDERAAALA